MLKGSCHCGNASWTLEGDPGSITICNCTLCRRYGALWAYDFEPGRISVSGRLGVYTRAGKSDPALEILFCPDCAGVAAWRGLRAEPDGTRRVAVNIRLADPNEVANLAIDRFDGLDTFDDLPSNGTCVRDIWF